jgi:predicted acylesterase/phospholipase RssA
MTLSKRVFRIDNVIKGIPVGSDYCRFNEEPLIKALKEIIRECTEDENMSMADPNDQAPDFCPVFVVATEGQDAGGPVKLFRSYGFYKDPCPIWQAARATSAAPSYFSPAWVDVPDPGGWYIDGGLRRNNPSEVALSEARKYWKSVRRFCIVSIGTGIQQTVDFIGVSVPSGDKDDEDSDEAEDVPISEESTSSPSTNKLTRFKGALGSAISSVRGGIGVVVSKVPLAKKAVHLSKIPGGILTLKRFAQELVKLSTESETHRKMWDLANNVHDESLRFPYYRFNVTAGMEQIGLEEWKKITKMGALTRGYLATPSIEVNVEECAKNLSNPASIESM